MKRIMIGLLCFMAMQAGAQEIAGKVEDEKKEPLMNCTVHIIPGGAIKSEAVTDYDGYYIAKPMDLTTCYDLVVYYAGYDTVTVTDVVVCSGRTVVNVKLSLSNGVPKNLLRKYRKPLIATNAKSYGVEELTKRSYRFCHGAIGLNVSKSEAETSDYMKLQEYPTLYKLTRGQIQTLPTADLRNIVALSPSVYQQQRGSDVLINGGRANETLYVVDKMQIMR